MKNSCRNIKLTSLIQVKFLLQRECVLNKSYNFLNNYNKLHEKHEHTRETY